MADLWAFLCCGATTETFIELYLTSSANSGISPLYLHMYARPFHPEPVITRPKLKHQEEGAKNYPPVGVLGPGDVEEENTAPD